jgi:ABC-type transport system involved in cytochrome c biogenesis permease component
MTVLPIVGRELVVAARRAVTYWTRFGVAASALVIFLFLRASYEGSIAALGHDLFFTLGVLVMGLCLLAGVFITADCLSVEKREGTLGLLFLTDLKGYDIVLGKLAANSVHAIFGLLAVFPVMGMSLLIGGVSGGEFWRIMLVFVVTLYFSLSVGILNSAACHEGRHSMIATLAIIVVVSTILPIFWEIQVHVLGGSFGNIFLLWPNPAYVFHMGFDAEYLLRFGAQEFWRSIAVIFSLATACILTASIILPRTWQSTSAPAKKSARLPFSPIFQKRRRRPLQDTAPFFWLALDDAVGRSTLDRVTLFLTIWWLPCVALWLGNPNGVFEPIAVYYVFGMHLILKVIMAAESTRRFNQDLQSGAMELLLVTPLPVRDIIAGQRKALQAQFRRPVLMLSAINVLMLYLALKFDPGLRQDSEGRHMVTVIFLGGALILWVDSFALTWVGMWRGVKSKKYPRAVLTTLTQITGLPWLAFFLFVAFMLLGRPSTSPPEPFVDGFVIVWFIVSACIDAVCIENARTNLAAHFRSVVAQRYDG